MKNLSIRFSSQDDGAMTAFGLLLTVAMIGVGGLAIDYGNAIMIRTHLQVAADSAAHAALLARDIEPDENAAKAIALSVAHTALPPSRFGDTILADDIIFGRWDDATDSFVAEPGNDDAVLVNTQRLASRGNSMATTFLRILGMNELDVVSQSVFETYRPTCFREGFVANERIDVQSNNAFREGFCIHSNSHVEMNNNNLFEDGVIVSMPNKSNLVIPSSGMSSNTGLADALRSGSYQIRILQRVTQIIEGYDDPSSKYYRPDYFNLPIETVALSKNQQIENGVGWEQGKVHTATCTGNQRIRIKGGATLSNGVIDTNCRIVIGSNATLENILIISTSTSLSAVGGPANITLGSDDGCSAGGGVQIITQGGFDFPAGLQMYGVQVLALKKIDFEANANGVEGVSLVTADEIDSTSNGDMGFCNGAGMENNFEAEYFRLKL